MPFVLNRPRAFLALALCLALALPVAPARADEGVVQVSAVVRGELAPTTPIPGVGISVFRWLDADGEWEQLASPGNDEQTGDDGRFSLTLEAGVAHTLLLTGPAPYPAQYLGGGPTLPSGPLAASWGRAVFVPGEDPFPAAFSLLSSHAFSVAGFALGDEDETAPSGWVELVDLSRVEDGPVADVPIDEHGGYVFHGLREGRSYTVRVTAEGYLPTYLGSTTQPELAARLNAAGESSAVEEITLRRGAALGGTVLFAGVRRALVHVSPLRWDPAGARWLAPEHPTGQPADTEEDGSFSLALEPGAIYTLHLDTSDVPGLPPSQYLGGRLTVPGPQDAAATFTLAPAGHLAEVTLLSPPAPPPSPPTPPTPPPPPTPPTPAPKGTSTTTIALKATSAPFGSKVTAKVTVRATRGTPSGTVTVRLGGKKLKAVRPTISGSRATATVTLPRSLLAGTHVLSASAAGTSTVTGSASSDVRLKVTKAKPRLSVKGPSKWRVKRGARPKVTVTVKGTKGGPTPKGKITVRFGKVSVTKSLKSGKVTVKGPKVKKKGSVKVTVSFAPKAKTYAKASVRKTLKVR